MAFKQKVGSATKNKYKKAVQTPKPSMFKLDTCGDEDDLDNSLDIKMDSYDVQEPPKTIGRKTLQAKTPVKQTPAKETPALKMDEEDDDSKEEDEDDEDCDEEDASKQNVLKTLKMDEEDDDSKEEDKDEEDCDEEDDSKENVLKKNLAIEQKNKEIEDKRDARQLIIKKLPVDITCQELKSLSDDIIHVILPNPDIVKKRKFKTVFAFVMFASEKKAEENFAVFASKKLREVPIEYEYAGVKGKTPQTADFAHNTIYDAKKLVISGLPTDTKVLQIAKLTPSATSIVTTSMAINSMAFASFDSEEAAAEAFEANKDTKINGTPVLFLYAKSNKKPFKRHLLKERKDTGKPIQHGGQPPLAKRPREDLDASSQN